MKKLISLSLMLFFAPILAWAASGCDGAGNCYILAGATGSGNGANWTNACKDFTGGCATTATTARGITFWVGNGTYSHCSYTAPDSGTNPITIMGATD